MYIHMIECDCATDAFEKAFNTVNNYGEIVDSRIGRTKHLTNMTIVINNPRHNVCINPQRNLSLRYLIGEINWYMSGSNRVDDIARYAKMWNDLSDDGETVNSAYGYRMFRQFGFDQLQYCIEKLRANPYDRQAIIHIKTPSDKPTKDMPCTCHIQFTCYHGRLEAHTYMRSNDIWLGLPYDVAFFTCLQQIVADSIGLACGKYYHTVGDLHLYEKHWDKKVKYTGDYDMDQRVWNWSDETPESIQNILDGGKPKNALLRELWRMNREKN